MIDYPDIQHKKRLHEHRAIFHCHPKTSGFPGFPVFERADFQNRVARNPREI